MSDTRNETSNARERRFGQLRLFSFRHAQLLLDACQRSAEVIKQNLSLALSLPTSVEVGEVYQESLRSYWEGLSEGAPVALFSFPPLPGKGAFCVDVKLAFVMLDRMLGGPGEEPSATRPLTQLERGIFEKLIAIMLRAIAEAWSHMVDCAPQIERIETASRTMANTLGHQGATDIVLSIPLKLHVGQSEGEARLCVSPNMLDPIVNHMARTARLVVQDEGDSNRHAMEAGIGRLVVELVAHFQPSVIPLGQILSFRVGDVIRLDHDVSSPVLVSVNGKTKFEAQPGLRGTRRAVQILRTIRSDENE